MCGRFAYYTTFDFDERFGITAPSEHAWAPSYNIAPGQHVPVIVEHDGSVVAETMKWGLIPSWAKDSKLGYKLINARSETIFDKPTWRSAVVRRRCLVPATGFYEWKRLVGSTAKEPYFIFPTNGGTWAFAGVYDNWHSPDGSVVSSFSIVTVNPNSVMAPIHDRMPVILHREDEEHWLDPDMEDRLQITDLLRPLEDQGMAMYSVSSDVNSPRNNDAHLVTPVASS